MAGVLYTYPNNFRAYKALIAAEYSESKVRVVSEPPEFVLGTTNKAESFLSKFPFGKVPAFETSDGTPIYESNAIAYYLANDELRGGSCITTRALVQQYINFADNEVLPSACTWVFPTLGLLQYNKEQTRQAQERIKHLFSVLNTTLATRTFLVGERVTLADITLCCNLLLLYKQVLDPEFRRPFVNVNRWFVTCVNQPQFLAVIGETTLCVKMAQFDAKRYNELFPKQKKEKKEDKKPKQEQPKKEKPKKKEPEPEDDEEQDDAPKPPSFVDPYADLPKSSFNMDEFKKVYSNKDTLTVAIPYLWENFDKEGWSIWRADYMYPDELKMIFMTCNLVSGMFQRLEKLHKTGFASICICGKDNDCTITGIWILRGQELAFNLVEDWNIDAPSYKFTKIDPDNDENREFMKTVLLQEGVLEGKEINQGKVFK